MGDLRKVKEKVEVFKHNPRLFTFSDIGVLPDNVKNYPLEAQEEFRLSFNANMERYNNPTFAMKAAWRCLQTKMEQIARRRQERRDQHMRTDQVAFARDRMKSITRQRVQVVVL